MSRFHRLAPAAGLVALAGLAAGAGLWRQESPASIPPDPSPAAPTAAVNASAPHAATRTDAPTATAVRRAARPARRAPHAVAPPARSRFEAGMVVQRDPETGQLGLPTPNEFRALTIDELQSLAARESEGLVTIRNADGSETLEHEGRFAEYVLVRMGADGKPVYECVSGAGLVPHALHPHRPAPAPVAEER